MNINQGSNRMKNKLSKKLKKQGEHTEISKVILFILYFNIFRQKQILKPLLASTWELFLSKSKKNSPIPLQTIDKPVYTLKTYLHQ